MEPDQLKAILAVCNGKTYAPIRDRTIVLALLQSGLRRAELAALNWADLDMREGVIDVLKGKGGKARATVLPPEAHEQLWRLLRAARKRGRGEATDPVFLSVAGKRLTGRAISQLVHNIGVRAGIPELHPHQFRHTWASGLLENGIQEHDLATLAGWSSTRMIARYGKAEARERALDAGKRFAAKVAL